MATTDKENTPSDLSKVRGGKSLTWVQVNNRLFELEKKKHLTKEEVAEWNKLLKLPIAGIIKRDEKTFREKETETGGEEKV